MSRGFAHEDDIENLPLDQLQSWKKWLAHLMQFITTIPIFTTKIENEAWHYCSKGKRKDSRIYDNPSPSPHLSMLGIWHWPLTTWLRSTLNWGNGGQFSLESDKMCQHFFFHDCSFIGDICQGLYFKAILFWAINNVEEHSKLNMLIPGPNLKSTLLQDHVAKCILRS